MKHKATGKKGGKKKDQQRKSDNFGEFVEFSVTATSTLIKAHPKYSIRVAFGEKLTVKSSFYSKFKNQTCRVPTTF